MIRSEINTTANILFMKKGSDIKHPGFLGDKRSMKNNRNKI